MVALVNLTISVVLGAAAFYVFLRHEKAFANEYAVSTVKNNKTEGRRRE